MNERARRAETSSDYMQWAKTRSHARFSLANSGVMNYTLAELGAGAEDLELSGPSAYGYAPLQEALAAKCDAPPSHCRGRWSAAHPPWPVRNGGKKSAMGCFSTTTRTRKIARRVRRIPCARYLMRACRLRCSGTKLLTAIQRTLL